MYFDVTSTVFVPFCNWRGAGPQLACSLALSGGLRARRLAAHCDRTDVCAWSARATLGFVLGGSPGAAAIIDSRILVPACTQASSGILGREARGECGAGGHATNKAGVRPVRPVWLV